MVPVLKSRLLADSQPGSLQGLGVNPGNDPTGGLEKIIGQVIGVLTIVAFVYFAIQIIFAGYAFLTSEGDEKKMESARKRLTEGVLGIVIIVVALGLAALIANLTGLGNIFDLNTMLLNMGLPPL